MQTAAQCSICPGPAQLTAENRRTGKIVHICDSAECRAVLDQLPQEPVDHTNYADVFEVGVSPDQLKFVDTPAEALVIANYGGKRMLPLLLYDDNHNPVGFAMLRLFNASDPTTIGISRFLISTEHQGRGLGRRHLAQLIRYIRRQYRPTAITLSVHNEAEVARRLYRTVGFEDVAARSSTPHHTDMIFLPGRHVTDANAQITRRIDQPLFNSRQQLDKAATIPIQSVEIRNAQFLRMLRADKQTPIELHMQYIDVPNGNICGGRPTPSHLALQRLFDENRDTTQIMLYSTNLHPKPYGGFCSTMQLEQGSGVLYLKHNVGSDEDDDNKIEVNLWMVANGWARYKDRKLWPNPMADRYVLAEVRASKNKLGLWDDSRYPGAWNELETRRKMTEEALPPAPPLTPYQLEHPPAPM